MSASGVRLDAETVERIAEADARKTRSGRVALWIAALSLAAIAIATIMG